MKKIILAFTLIVLSLVSCEKEPTPIPVTSITLDMSSLTLIEGESARLTATISPSNADNQSVIWSSSNASVAMVSNGTITAIAAGLATITAKSDDGGKTSTCSVTVKAKTVGVDGISLDKSEASLKVGDTVTLTATVSPYDATDKTVTWSTSDASVATVKDGVVTAIMVGTATITAKAGEKTTTCNVTVEPGLDSFTITSVGSTTVSIAKVRKPHDIVIEYRKGTGSWNAYTIGNEISLADGDHVQIRAGEGGNNSFSMDGNNYYKIVVTGDGNVKASGNIMSLLDRSLKRSTMPDYVFFGLFYGCTKLLEASKLVLPAATLAMACYFCMFIGCTSLTAAPTLPATTLAESCYSQMFQNCTSLTSAPELPASTLADWCYSDMFSSCTSLTSAPELPATTLAKGCYLYMFQNCTSLTSVPTLPATTLAESCYWLMFQNCTSLTSAPELPATTLVVNCYSGMFEGCSKLDYVKALFTTIPSNSYTSNWLAGVSSTGTFVKSKNANWNVTGTNGIPSGWTVKSE